MTKMILNTLAIALLCCSCFAQESSLARDGNHSFYDKHDIRVGIGTPRSLVSKHNFGGCLSDGRSSDGDTYIDGLYVFYSSRINKHWKLNVTASFDQRDTKNIRLDFPEDPTRWENVNRTFGYRQVRPWSGTKMAGSHSTQNLV